MTKREKIVDKICVVLNIEKTKMKATSLIDKLPEDEREKLKETVNKLKKIVSEVKEIGDTNGMLIKSSLDYVEFTLNLMRATSEKVSNTQYQRKGNLSYGNYTNQANFFDTKQ